MEEVKCSYRELVKVWHPDRFGGDPKLQRKAGEKLKEINLAYEWISKGEAAVPRRRTRSARPSSSGTGQQANRTGSQSRSKQEQAREQSPPPKAEPSSHKTERAEAASQKAQEAKWAFAAIGFGGLALSLLVMSIIWDDFSKYEAGESIRTTRNMFLLYQLLGKQGAVAFFMLLGLFVGYTGLCHARALLSGHRHITFIKLKMGHLIAAAVVIGLFALIGNRPEKRSVVRKALTVEQIVELHRDALNRNPSLTISVQEYSQYAQDAQTEFDYSAGIAYFTPPQKDINLLSAQKLEYLNRLGYDTNLYDTDDEGKMIFLKGSRIKHEFSADITNSTPPKVLLTQEQKLKLLKLSGYDPAIYDIDDEGTTIFSRGSSEQTQEHPAPVVVSGHQLDTIKGLERAVEYYQRVLMPRTALDLADVKTFKPTPPLTNLDQLVEWRVIRAVPHAPPGQKYIYDTESGQVKLVAQ